MIHDVDHAALVHFLTGMVGRDDAEDIAAETYLAALTARPPDGRARSSTWLYAVARNQAKRHLRTKGRRQVAEQHAPVPMSTVPVEFVAHTQSLCAEDQALIAARLAHGSVPKMAVALGLTRRQVQYRWARLKRRVG